MGYGLTINVLYQSFFTCHKIFFSCYVICFSRDKMLHHFEQRWKIYIRNKIYQFNNLRFNAHFKDLLYKHHHVVRFL